MAQLWKGQYVLVVERRKKSSKRYTCTMTGELHGTDTSSVAVVAGGSVNGTGVEMTMNSSRGSLLTVSLTVNCCTLSFFVIRACLSELMACKFSCWRRGVLGSLAKLHRDNQWMLPKIFVEQLLSWSLIVISVVELVRGDIVQNPFVPKTSRDLTLSGTAFCMNIGKYIYKMAQDTILVKHMKRYKADMLHHVVTVSCYAVFQTYSENILLGLVGLLMECDLIWRDIGGIFKRIQPEEKSYIYKRVIVLGAVMTILSRGALPVAFVILALINQPLTRMHFASIIFLFIGLIFFLAINVWLVVKAAMRINKFYKRKLQPTRGPDCELTEVPSIGSHVNSTVTGMDIQRVQRPVPVGHTIPLSIKNDLNYLRSYANTNIANSTEDTKLNFMNKKTLAKPMVGNLRQLTSGSHLNNEYIRLQGARTVIATHQDSAESSPRSNSSVELLSVGPNVRIGYLNIETRADETGQGVHHVVLGEDR